MYKVDDHPQVAGAHEDLAYATYVEKYSSGKCQTFQQSAPLFSGSVTIAKQISFSGMFEGAEKQARASLAIVKRLLPKRCFFLKECSSIILHFLM